LIRTEDDAMPQDDPKTTQHDDAEEDAPVTDDDVAGHRFHGTFTAEGDDDEQDVDGHRFHGA
jgi:hypothetical protein